MYIMSKETELKDLDTNLSKEEEEIVDSIISELNQEVQPSTSPSKEDNPSIKVKETSEADLHKQNMMKQQQMMQQQMMHQQMMHQQQQNILQRQKLNEQDEKEVELSMIDKLKVDFKQPAIVAFLTFVAVLPYSQQLIESMKISFLLDGENLNIYGLVLKSLIIGFIYFILNKYVLV